MKNKNNTKKIIRLVTLIFTILTLAKIYYDAKLLDLTLGILKLEFGKNKIARVHCKSLMFISKIEASDQIFEEEMNAKGWEKSDVYGRGHLFEKNGEEILIIVKEHFGRYKLYEIQNKLHFLSNENED